MHPGSRLLCLLALPDFATPRPEDTVDCSPAAGQGHNPPDSHALLSNPLRARSHVGSINAPKCVPAGLRNLSVMLCRATGSGRELGCGCPAMPPLLKSWRPTIRHAKRQLPDRWRQLMRVRVWEDGVAAAGSQALTQAGSFASSARRRLPGMDDAFYLPLGHDRWRATVHTAGPWDTRFQHGGPGDVLTLDVTQPTLACNDVGSPGETWSVALQRALGESCDGRYACCGLLSVCLLYTSDAADE